MAAHDILNRDIRKLARKMERDGYEFRCGTSGHLRVFAPDGAYLGPLSSSPGTPRWELARLRSMQRRAACS